MAKAPKAAYDTYDYDADDSYAPKAKAPKAISVVDVWGGKMRLPTLTCFPVNPKPGQDGEGAQGRLRHVRLRHGRQLRAQGQGDQGDSLADYGCRLRGLELATTYVVGC